MCIEKQGKTNIRLRLESHLSVALISINIQIRWQTLISSSAFSFADFQFGFGVLPFTAAHVVGAGCFVVDIHKIESRIKTQVSSQS